MSTHDYAAAAGTVSGLVGITPARQEHFDYTAEVLREMAAQAKAADARLETFAIRLRDVYTSGWSTQPAPWSQIKPESRNGWLNVAREAEAVHAEVVEDCDWTARADTPTPIPADATGLKGRRAKIVGPATSPEYGDLIDGIEDTVQIEWDRPNAAGDLAVTVYKMDGGIEDQRILASSLAPIPEPEPAPVEPPVGTRLRDKDGVIRTRLESGWSTPISMIQWPNLVKNFGPLHQVFSTWADIPHEVIATDDLGDKVIGCPPGCPEEHRFVAPFVAVDAFGAGQ